MLVLSRKENEKIVLPTLNVAIEVVAVKGRTVRLGIAAPKDVPVMREEIQDRKAEWDKVASDAGYHYLGSAKTFCAIGRAFGEAMIELCRSGAKN